MKNLLLLSLLLLSGSTFSQKNTNAQELSFQKSEVISIPMKPENWEFKPETVAFLEHKSRPAMKLLTSKDQVILKDLKFTNGVIEYDMEPLDPRFTSLYFRWNGLAENECFYFRTQRAGDPLAIDAIQYAPQLDGVNLWDMLFHFQTNADFKREDWNHVKLVISGQQMQVFVNDMDRPCLEIPKLEGNVTDGALAFDGQVIISNLVVKPNDVEGLSPAAGIDPTVGDPRYLRQWQVSEPIPTAQYIDFSYEYFPSEETQWETITAERRGLINLTRKFGKTEGRRIVWLTTTLHSSIAQERMLDLGFSDEVWVYINNQPLYMDKNLYATPMMKQPEGRCSIENTSFRVPLNEGENQLLIGVANSFYGWGIVARLDKLTDLTLEK